MTKIQVLYFVSALERNPWILKWSNNMTLSELTQHPLM